MNSFLRFHPEVRAALDGRAAVVALESTIVAHGMSYPQNFQTAIEVQEIIRSHGAVPATVAILDGKLCIGLSDSELEQLAVSGSTAGKVSRRDLAAFLDDPRLVGATTVASTMIAAHAGGIRVFVTGGIGGVHRGAERTWDVSADLHEFTRSGVAVVSAGAKAILDIPATLEYLETLGVPVVGFGTSEFPAFYSRNSGVRLNMGFDHPEDLAKMLLAHWEIDPHGGVLVANPIPHEFEIPAGEIEPSIVMAVEKANARGIQGKQLTPFLLKELAEITGGRSLEANIALVKNNAHAGARIALALQGQI